MRTGLLALFAVCAGCATTVDFDIVLRGGLIYDGSGEAPYVGDLAISADTIAALGDLDEYQGRSEYDVRGLAVSPGFINMLSWATESLIRDGRSQSDIRQGITLEVFGEGQSMGPLNDEMIAGRLKDLITYLGGEDSYREALGIMPEATLDLPWATLDEYLEFLVAIGISPNIASFVGATTVRVHELGYENRAPTQEELERMRALVDAAMQDGALGVGSALMYAPAFYADTDELVALCRVVSNYGGMYISHIRSEGNGVVESVEELISIALQADVPAEIYHLKAAGRDNWAKLDTVFARVEDARANGLAITANMYTYTAGLPGWMLPCLRPSRPEDLKPGECACKTQQSGHGWSRR